MKYVAILHHVREVTLRGDGMMLVAAEGVFHGIRFRELSISRVIGEHEAVLLQAFNSNRFFAFCERTFFSTPYAHADVRVELTKIAVDDVLRAEMPALPAPVVERPESWSGEVHLPKDRKFYAHLEGFTRKYAFTGTFETTLDVLRDFRPLEWSVREDATHRKSRTYKR